MATFVIWLLIVSGSPGQKPATAGDKPVHQDHQAKSTEQHQQGIVADVHPKVDQRNPASGTNDTAQNHNAPASTPAKITQSTPLFVCLVVWLSRLNSDQFIAFLSPFVGFLALIVTTLYLLATILIWRAMATSNNLSKAAQKEGKDAADADRKLMQGQLNEMQATANATYAIAESASISSGAVIGQWEAMNQQTSVLQQSVQTAIITAGILRQQLEAYERPWLTASIPLLNPRDNPSYCGFWPDGRALVRFPFVIKNVGKSVATNITFVTDLVIVGHDRDRAVISPERRIALRELKPDLAEFSLFPGDDSGLIAPQMEAPKAAIEVSTFTLAKGGERFVSMAVIGRITYRYATSDSPHHTEFAFLVGKKVPNLPSAMTYPSPGTRIEGDDVAWLKASGDQAD